MRVFSARSRMYLNQCDPRFTAVAEDVLQLKDCSIIEGHRTEERQNQLYPKFTKVKWPDSKHNKMPSEAIHIVPYIPGIGAITGHSSQAVKLAAMIDSTVDDAKQRIREEFTYLAGLMVMCGRKHNVKIRWGGDWDRDGDLFENNFDDLAHYEIEGIIEVVEPNQETIVNTPTDVKPALQSKTVWTNLLAPVLSWGLDALGLVVPMEVQLSILAIANIGLRLVTNSAIGSVK